MSLSVVPSAADPEPPYPSDVRARGWPFELDAERIKQSMTWIRAADEAKPWLLLLWLESWTQCPAGSLPADENDVAALLRMPLPQFVLHRDTLLRGWVRHRDGRLYHRVVTEMVLRMMGARRRDRERKSLARKESDGFHRIPKDSAAASDSVSASVSASEDLKTDRSSPKAPTTTAQTPQRKNDRGTRLPKPWEPPEQWVDWATRNTAMQEHDVMREALIFRDHWYAKPGKDGRKVDWFATWRNWMRRSNP